MQLTFITVVFASWLSVINLVEGRPYYQNTDSSYPAYDYNYQADLCRRRPYLLYCKQYPYTTAAATSKGYYPTSFTQPQPRFYTRDDFPRPEVLPETRRYSSPPSTSSPSTTLPPIDMTRPNAEDVAREMTEWRALDAPELPISDDVLDAKGIQDNLLFPDDAASTETRLSRASHPKSRPKRSATQSSDNLDSEYKRYLQERDALLRQITDLDTRQASPSSNTYSYTNGNRAATKYNDNDYYVSPRPDAYASTYYYYPTTTTATTGNTYPSYGYTDGSYNREYYNPYGTSNYGYPAGNYGYGSAGNLGRYGSTSYGNPFSFGIGSGINIGLPQGSGIDLGTGLGLNLG